MSEIIKYPPYLADIIGAGEEWMPGKFTNDDVVQIAKNALACNDVFVVYSRDDLSPVFAELVRQQLGIEPRLFPGGSLEEYKHRLEIRNASDYKEAYLVERLSVRCKQSLTPAAARKIMGEVYPKVLAWATKEMAEKLNAIISELIACDSEYKAASVRGNPATSVHGNVLGRLLRSIYALPHHPIIYEDNGAEALQDSLCRLEAFKQDSRCQQEDFIANVAELKTLAEEYNGQEEWFNKISELRKKLIVALTPVADPFIKNELRERMVMLLGEIAQCMKSHADAKNVKKKTIVQAYLKDMSQDILDKYRYPADGTKPFVCNGVLVVDMDACTDKRALQSTLDSSRKIIALGRIRDGQFYEILRGAHGLSQKDGKTRIAVYGVPPHPLYTHWLYPNASSSSLRELVHHALDREFRVGILSQNANRAFSGEFPDAVKIGSLREFYHEKFDTLFWLADSKDDAHAIAIARAKARHTMVVVGNPMELPADSPLQDLYHRAMGDDLYGKVYH